MAIKYFTEVEYTAICHACKNTESVYNSDGEYRTDDTPSRFFRRNGWHDETGVTLCPECYKRYKEEVNKNEQ